jgi:hypothetical protein
LLKQITDQQEAYCVLCEHNVRLFNELNEANQTIERPFIGDRQGSLSGVDLFPNQGWLA